MIGNAVPVEFARNIALKIKQDLKDFLPKSNGRVLKGKAQLDYAERSV
jgi:hypothetical protein